MLKYIKMDLYKLFKSKFFYVCMLVFLVLIIFVIVDTKWAEREVLSDKSQISIAEAEETHYADDTFYTSGIGSDGFAIVELGINLKNLVNASYGSNIMVLMLLITVVIFICNDFSSGYIKNTITIPRYKWYTNISKLVTAAVILMVQNLIAIIAYLWAIKYCFRSGVVGSFKGLIPYLAVEMVLYLGITAFFLLICDWTQSKALGISVSVFYACQLIGTMAVFILYKVFDLKKEKAMKMVISVTQGNLMVGMSNTVLKESLVLGIASMFVYMTLANIIVCKRDY